MNYTFGQLLPFAYNAGFDQNSAPIISAIALAESGGNPNAVYTTSKESSYGLLQINAFAWGYPMAQASLDPQTAFNNAYTISKGGTNFNPWTTYFTSDPSRNYMSFLPSNYGGNAAPVDTSGVVPPTFSTYGDTSIGLPSGGVFGNTPDYANTGSDQFGSGLTANPTVTNFDYGNSNPNDPFAVGGGFGQPTGTDTSLNLSPDIAAMGGSVPTGTDLMAPGSAATVQGANQDVWGNTLFGQGANSPVTNQAASQWWNTATTIAGDYVSRIGLFLLAVILIGAAAFAFTRGEKAA